MGLTKFLVMWEKAHTAEMTHLYCSQLTAESSMAGTVFPWQHLVLQHGQANLLIHLDTLRNEYVGALWPFEVRPGHTTTDAGCCLPMPVRTSVGMSSFLLPHTTAFWTLCAAWIVKSFSSDQKTRRHVPSATQAPWRLCWLPSLPSTGLKCRTNSRHITLN